MKVFWRRVPLVFCDEPNGLIKAIRLLMFILPFAPGLEAQPWQDQDVGAVAVAGSASWTSNTVRLTGSGADIWDVVDAFHYVFQLWSGDGIVVAEVGSLSNTDPWAKTGLMFRQ